MKYLPPGVRGTRDDQRGYGYIVTLPDGTEEWHRLAWQATARAHGWTPPALKEPKHGEAKERVRSTGERGVGAVVGCEG